MAISTLRAGDEVAGVFACTRKDRLLSRAGAPYLAVELRDRTGALAGRVFRDADLHAGRFDRGDLVRVAGRVERFRDELQVELRAIGRAREGEADPAAFLPVAYRDLDELDGFLEHLAREVHDPGLSALLDALLDDAALRAEWRRAPCTRNGHHAYLGGLLEHTVAVGTLVTETCVLHPRLDSDLLMTAALVGCLAPPAGAGHEPSYRTLLERLLGDASLRAEWRRAPCTRDGHHAYLGGLLEHTVAVAQLALETCQLHVRLNSDLLITAALVHDLGKTREFTYGAEIGVSEEGRLLGHVELGLEMLRSRAEGVLDAERLVALSHCVLTHHGADRAPARRFGSPEALALYRLNALDAGVKGALEHGIGLDE